MSNKRYSFFSVGVHKRDILVDRVEGARDAQSEAQQEFKDALEQFASVVELSVIKSTMFNYTMDY